MFKQFIIYSSGAIILRLITACSVLATIKFIDPTQFGILALLNNLMIFLPIFLGLGLRQVLAIEFFNKQNYWNLIWELVTIYLTFAIPVITILFLNLTHLNHYLFLNQINNSLLAVAILTSFINFFPELLFQLLRFQNKAFTLTIIQISMGVILATITIGLLTVGNLGIASVLWAQLISQTVATCYFGYLITHSCLRLFAYPEPVEGRTTCLQATIHHLKVGLPFVPNIIFAWLIIGSNRWLLNWHLHLADVGVYSLAENISLIFQALVAQPLMSSFLPHAFKKFAQNPTNLAKIDKQYTKYAYLFALFFAITIPLGFILGKPVLAYLLPAKYITALPLITPLLLAQVIFASTYITSASVQYHKKTHYLAIGMAISAIISIIINLWLIPIYGVYSCLIATNCAYLCYFIFVQVLKIQPPLK